MTSYLDAVFGEMQLTARQVAVLEYSDRRAPQPAKSTARLYRYAWAQYSKWCSEHLKEPLGHDENIISEYLEHLLLRLAPSSVRTHLAAIVAAHKLVGVSIDTAAGALGAGVVIRHGDIAAASAEICALLRVEQRRAEIGARAVKRVREYYKFDAYCQKLSVHLEAASGIPINIGGPVRAASFPRLVINTDQRREATLPSIEPVVQAART